MGLQPTKTVLSSGVPVWQGRPRVATGGFVLAAAVIAALGGSTIYAGTPVAINEATRQATVLKTAKVVTAATNVAVAIQVAKGHHFKVGDYVAKTVGGAAYAITAIDTSNAAYDSFTVGTTLGVALAVGDVLFQSSATGATAGAYNVTPTALVYDDVDVAAEASCSAVLAGIVYERRIPGFPPALKASLPNLIFSQSY
jgi:hypothetical protein